MPYKAEMKSTGLLSFKEFNILSLPHKKTQNNQKHVPGMEISGSPFGRGDHVWRIISIK